MSNGKQEDLSLDKAGGHGELELPPGVKLLRSVPGHEGTVLSVAFDPTGRMLASGSNDLTVKLWETATGKVLRTLEGHESSVFSVGFDSVGRTLASAGYDGTTKLWEVG